VAYITTNVRNPRVEVPLTPADGVRQPRVVDLDSINTIPKSRLRYRICLLSPAKMLAVNAAIEEALGMR
jgi:mRNA-degrading endonuclease toxin of MazEF toxin-antitoxin module